MTTPPPHDHGQGHPHGHDHATRPPRRRERPPGPPERRPGRRHGAGDRLPRGVCRPRPRRRRRPLRARRLRPLLAREPDRAARGRAPPLVACAGDQVVGLAAVGPSQDPDAGGAQGEVTVLGVHPDARRQGHGSRLLNASVDLLREAGADVGLALAARRRRGRARLPRPPPGFAPDGAYPRPCRVPRRGHPARGAARRHAHRRLEDAPA